MEDVRVVALRRHANGRLTVLFKNRDGTTTKREMNDGEYIAIGITPSEIYVQTEGA